MKVYFLGNQKSKQSGMRTMGVLKFSDHKLFCENKWLIFLFFMIVYKKGHFTTKKLFPICHENLLSQVPGEGHKSSPAMLLHFKTRLERLLMIYDAKN